MEEGKGMREPVAVLYVMVMFWWLIATITAEIRRLHDIGHSGWLLLLGLIPYVGGIILLILLIFARDVAL